VHDLAGLRTIGFALANRSPENDTEAEAED
jgi:hypothetical protein